MGPEIDLLNETARYIPPMLEDEFYLTYASEMEASKKNKQAATLSKALVPVVGMNHTLWAAAKDNQVSMEGNLSGQIRGYFTYHFCKYYGRPMVISSEKHSTGRWLLHWLLWGQLRSIRQKVSAQNFLKKYLLNHNHERRNLKSH
jgi:hypothetical protein